MAGFGGSLAIQALGKWEENGYDFETGLGYRARAQADSLWVVYNGIFTPAAE